jgi:hypothetical protein
MAFQFCDLNVPYEGVVHTKLDIYFFLQSYVAIQWIIINSYLYFQPSNIMTFVSNNSIYEHILATTIICLIRISGH